MRRLPATSVYYWICCFGLHLPTWVVMSVYLVRELHLSPLQLGLVLQVAVGVVSLRAGVILGGAFTILCGLAAIAFMPETGFRRRPAAERASALTEMRTTAVAGGRYAWAAPVIMLLIAVELFMG